MTQIKTAPQDELNVKTAAEQRVRNSNGRPWTAVERHKLRGLIERGLPASTIARTLRRPLVSITIGGLRGRNSPRRAAVSAKTCINLARDKRFRRRSACILLVAHAA